MPSRQKIEAGHVYLPRRAEWLEDFRTELLQFPKGRYDDQVVLLPRRATSDFPETVYSFYSIDEVNTLLGSAGFVRSTIQNAGTTPGQMFLAMARRPQ